MVKSCIGIKIFIFSCGLEGLALLGLKGILSNDGLREVKAGTEGVLFVLGGPVGGTQPGLGL